MSRKPASSWKYNIASWKIDSSIERLLSAWADKSEIGKRLYVLYYKLSQPEYYRKGLAMIQTELEKHGIYGGGGLVVDMIYSLHRFGCMFDEYFFWNFPSLTVKARDAFVTDKLRYDYYTQMNRQENQEVFCNKKLTYDTFSKYYERDVIFVGGEEDKAVFEDFARKHSEFIVKPYHDSCGRGIEKMSTAGLSTDECFSKLLSRLGGGLVCEELIVQSEIMASFHPQSINTVRIPTIRTKDDVVIITPFFRTARGGKVVDNASSGGIFSLVDPETGIVFSKGLTIEGGTFMKHPDSGVVFPGFQLPDWDKAKALVKELAMVVPSNRYTGWDLAHTANGWIMVEGNDSGDLKEIQYCNIRGGKAELEQYIKAF